LDQAAQVVIAHGGGDAAGGLSVLRREVDGRDLRRLGQCVVLIADLLIGGQSIAVGAAVLLDSCRAAHGVGEGFRDVIVGIDVLLGIVERAAALWAVQFVDTTGGGIGADRGTPDAGNARRIEDGVVNGDDAAQGVLVGHGSRRGGAVLVFGRGRVHPAAARRDLEGKAGETGVGLVIVDGEYEYCISLGSLTCTVRLPLWS